MTKLLLSFCTLILLLSCGGNELLIPKPPTYLRTDYPEHTYKLNELAKTYSFELSTVYFAKLLTYKGEETNHQEINLGPINGTLFLNYYPVPNRDTLVRYINLSNDKVDEHQIKATKIIDENIIQAQKKVYGTFFELQGDVATNFQFYLTDSTSRFIRGEILLNCRPNYDSLKPTLDYIKQDLKHLIQTFEWK
jgi:gliding motility-associated lipoprotein GldD